MGLEVWLKGRRKVVVLIGIEVDKVLFCEIERKVNDVGVALTTPQPPRFLSSVKCNRKSTFKQ